MGYFWIQWMAERVVMWGKSRRIRRTEIVQSASSAKIFLSKKVCRQQTQSCTTPIGKANRTISVFFLRAQKIPIFLLQTFRPFFSLKMHCFRFPGISGGIGVVGHGKAQNRRFLFYQKYICTFTLKKRRNIIIFTPRGGA